MERDPVDEKTADLINEILCLDLDWDFTNRATYSLKDLQAFDDLCCELAPRLHSSKLDAAVWFLAQARFIVRDGIGDGEIFQPLSLTAEQRSRLKVLLSSYPVPEEAFSTIRAAARSGTVLSTLLTWEDKNRIFEMLMEAEREILRTSGLNQRSVSIVSQRINEYKVSIFGNIMHGKSYINVNRITATIQSLTNLAKISVRLSDRKRPDESVTLRSIRNLARAKDKVIGLATLWGDALPLVTMRDWGIASVFSAAAGATVAAVLPRHGPH